MLLIRIVVLALVLALVTTAAPDWSPAGPETGAANLFSASPAPGGATSAAGLAAGLANGIATPAAPITVHDAQGNMLAGNAFSGELPAFEQRYVGVASAGEPTIVFDGRGGAYYQAITFPPGFELGGCIPSPENCIMISQYNAPSASVHKSVDGGSTWSDVTPPELVGSCDNHMIYDRVLDRLIDVNVYCGNEDPVTSMGGYETFSSTDEAATWSRALLDPVFAGVVDHPSIASGPAPPLLSSLAARVVYLCNNSLVEVLCAWSLDGGDTWQATGRVPYPCSAAISVGAGIGFDAGYGLIHVSEHDGTLYVPMGGCAKAHVAVSKDGGLTFETILIDETAGAPEGWSADRLFVRVTTDRAGNAYAMFLDREHLPVVSVSRDQGATWSAPIRVSAPGVTLAKLPAIVVGDAGRAAFLYIGTTVPGGANASAEDWRTARWDAYIGMSLDLLAGSPTIATVLANPADDPIMRGPCQVNFRCHVSATMEEAWSFLDYMELHIDPVTHLVWATMADQCNGECVMATSGPDGYPPTNRGAVAVQTAGPSLFDD